MPIPKIILVIVSHTDDETIGMGGTIVNHVDRGDKVYCMAMTDWVGSRNIDNDLELNKRLLAAKEASKTLGFKWLKFNNFPDNAMDSVSLLEIIKVIETEKKRIIPDIIYTHSAFDLNIDHRIVNQATLTAFRPQPNETYQEIRTFEIPSSTDYANKLFTYSFNPNLYINIGKNWTRKYEAIKNYDSEIRQYPHSRSYKGIENLAKYRGNQVGLEYAEAFEVIRKIIRWITM